MSNSEQHYFLFFQTPEHINCIDLGFRAVLRIYYQEIYDIGFEKHKERKHNMNFPLCTAIWS